MLRFRPSLPPEISGAAKYGRRTKRKYVRVRGRQSAKTRPPQGKSGIDDGTPPERAVVTLQLLPDRSESEKSCCYSSIAPKLKDMIDPDGHRFGDEVRYKTDLTAATWIVVECVTDTSVDGLGYSDEEILKHLLSGLRIGRRQQRGLGKEDGIGERGVGERKIALSYPLFCMQSEDGSADKARAEME